ncbi:MAG: single-stranded DNA-binding protein [Bacteroidales bacterium]|nr:single-stranded DNA-binding protein [Bacteroidales bacterium]
MRLMTISGRLTKDATIERSKHNKKYLLFRIANVEATDQKGEDGKPIPTWYDVYTSDEMLMRMKKNLLKGRPINVVGRYSDYLYKGDDGEMRIGRNIYATSISYELSYFTPKEEKAERTQTVSDANRAYLGAQETEDRDYMEELPF